ncbi:MAG: helix-turn-helix domain-containing protein [Pseudonocardiaceae bacterium]
MTPPSLLDDNLLARARELRAAGRSPKEIARALGVRPSTVAPLMRDIAREAAADEPESAVTGCWVSPGWRAGLTVDGHEEWPDLGASDHAASGLIGVAVARRYRPRRVTVCGYLVDVYCLGVKNALGPDAMNERDLPAFVRTFFSAFGHAGTPMEAPLDLARHLVWGAVDYARELGFSPHSDFQATSGHLGAWQETSDITFGRDGVPFYVQGPYDGPAVIRTLTRSVGEGTRTHEIGPGRVSPDESRSGTILV